MEHVRLVTGLLASLVILLSLSAVAQPLQPANLLTNPGFEDPAGAGWIKDLNVADKGYALTALGGTHSGRFSLKLVPNEQNLAGTGQGTLGVGQLLDAGAYQGKSLYFSGWMQARGGVTAVIRLLGLHSNGRVTFRELRQQGESPGNVLHRDVLEIPAEPELLLLVIICTVEGAGGAAYFDDLTVSTELPADWKVAHGEPDIGPNLSASVRVDASRRVRSIPGTLYGTNLEWISNGHGLWNAEDQELDGRFVELGRALNMSMLRFPGGFFSDFYHWPNGVGPHESRPETRAISPSDLSPNGFGTDEVLEYAARIGSEVMITVNVLTGTPEEAAEWVRYVNNGERYVRYWEIGNEPYVDLTSFDPEAAALPPDRYAARLLEFAAAMKAVDPAIRIGAALDFNYGRTTFRAFPEWTDVVLETAGAAIDFVSVHNAFAPVVGPAVQVNARTVYSAMLAAPLQIRDTLVDLTARIEAILGPDSHVEIAITEWGPLFHDGLDSPYSDHTKTMGSALYVASTLKTFIEQPRVRVATAFKFFDAFPLAWIGIRNGEILPKSLYYAMQMFSNHFHTELVETVTVAPTYESRSVGWVDSERAVPYLEALASVNAAGDQIAVMLINKHFDRSIETRVALEGYCEAQGEAAVWHLTGTAPDANTGTDFAEISGIPVVPQARVEPGSRFDLGSPEELRIEQTHLPIAGAHGFTYVAPPHSITSILVDSNPELCEAPEEPGFDLDRLFDVEF